jgi:hypothetical protein
MFTKYLFSLCLLFIGAISSLTAAATLPKGELSMLNALIEATQRSLEQQKNLLEQVKKYQELQQRYIEDPENKELLLQLAKEALRVQKSIEATHLKQAFEPEFLSELTLFSQIGLKRGIPRP